MTTYRNTVKSALLNYPSIFPSKFAVNAHLFAVIGIGMEWSDKGTLEYTYKTERKSKTMRYDDLDKRLEELKIEEEKLKQYPSMRSLHAMFRAQIESERIMRKFTEDNLNTILDNRCGQIPFNRGNTPTLRTYMKPNQVCYKYAAAFNFPDNITVEWAKGLEDFIGEWMYILNVEYMPGQKPDYMKHWPENAQKLYNRLQEEREKLLTIITGKSTEVRRAEDKAMTDKIIAELKAEE